MVRDSSSLSSRRDLRSFPPCRCVMGIDSVSVLFGFNLEQIKTCILITRMRIPYLNCTPIFVCTTGNANKKINRLFAKPNFATQINSEIRYGILI